MSIQKNDPRKFGPMVGDYAPIAPDRVYQCTKIVRVPTDTTIVFTTTWTLVSK